MANDASSKPTTNDSTLSNASDQQKVPPLRIVLNSAGNQKSLSAATTVVSSVAKQQANTKKEKAQDAKSEGSVKVGGRVRIKLGTNKQSGSKDSGNKANDTTITKATSGSTTNNKIVENINEDSTSSFNHLRRITRRSQRAVQSTANEDEESISSMTSTDENLNTNNNLSNGDNLTQDSEQSNSATLSSSSAPAASNATNGSTSADTPRRYKRRKVETSESQSIDCDNLLGSQNYRLPHQNSFELFKNIRKQVDKRLKSLNNVSPRTPYGFRDYMLTRGAYLLEGNKLGNGTNLFMNEDGGLNSASTGKYRVLRHSMTSYSVPNRAKVPLGLAVNSPLYDLFVEQEKERYRMRIQHIKEREKLTLAAEQEVIRVYHQAALAAADQSEPFSACTMLKHQEIYNYMDSNGLTILSRDDALQDQVQSDGVRTRRRQHEHISPNAPTRKSSDAEQTSVTDKTEQTRKGSQSSLTDNQKTETDTQECANSNAKEPQPEKEVPSTEEVDETKEGASTEESAMKNENSKQPNDIDDSSGICPISPPESSTSAGKYLAFDESGGSAINQSEIKTEAIAPLHSQWIADEPKPNKSPAEDLKQSSECYTNDDHARTQKTESSAAPETKADNTDTQVAKQMRNESVSDDAGSSIEDKKIQHTELFLSKLQEVDDKWEKIRHEMLVRHKNEAESLHAIQKLEWEWKTKEIGACDVRTNLVIDDTLVPRLDIYSQDY